MLSHSHLPLVSMGHISAGNMYIRTKSWCKALGDAAFTGAEEQDNTVLPSCACACISISIAPFARCCRSAIIVGPRLNGQRCIVLRKTRPWVCRPRQGWAFSTISDIECAFGNKRKVTLDLANTLSLIVPPYRSQQYMPDPLVPILPCAYDRLPAHPWSPSPPHPTLTLLPRSPLHPCEIPPLKSHQRCCARGHTEGYSEEDQGPARSSCWPLFQSTSVSRTKCSPSP